MRLPRSSGILLHPTSLPGRFGIGDLGPEAIAFVELLAEMGQRWWQMLPLGPPGAGNSPYQSHSSFAGNALLISPDRLVEDGLLAPQELEGLPQLPEGEADFVAVAEVKDRLLRLAFQRFRDDLGRMDDFRRQNAGWLDDYAFYTALKAAQGGHPWYDWEPGLVNRQPEAMHHWGVELVEELHYQRFVQYVFSLQWDRLRRVCRDRQVGLIGDLPIFVSLDSADVWARPDLFAIEGNGRPTVVAGVPPDYFSETGQLWGNPLYRWDVHASEGFAWWLARLRATTDRVDLVRLDHFRGFQAYWEVPADAETAMGGRWAPGPGAAFFEAVNRDFGRLPIIAEDLGLITPEVLALRDQFDLPGMRVLQFGFSDDAVPSEYLPFRYQSHCVVYTGTHDNDTTVGWFTGSEGNTTQTSAVKAAEQGFVRRYTGTNGEEIHWDLIRLALGSVADTAIVPLQDVLGLGSEARMNVPGRATGNWHWRFCRDQLTPSIAARLADLTAVYHRWNGPIPDHLHLCPPLMK